MNVIISTLNIYREVYKETIKDTLLYIKERFLNLNCALNR